MLDLYEFHIHDHTSVFYENDSLENAMASRTVTHLPIYVFAPPAQAL